MSTAVNVTVYNGKYTIIFDEQGLRALRYGEPWRDCCGDGLILALAQEIEILREFIHDLPDKVREAGVAGQTGTGLKTEAPIFRAVSDFISDEIEDADIGVANG